MFFSVAAAASARHHLAATLLLLLPVLAPAAAPPAVDGRAVSVAFGPDGRLWRVASRGNQLEVDYSKDLGRQFSTPVPVAPRGRFHALEPEGRPWISVDAAGVLYVAWAGPGARPMLAQLVRSRDGGRTWSPPVTPAGGPATQIRVRLDARGPGPARLFFLDPGAMHGAGGEPALYMATVTGAGDAPPVLELSAPLTGVCECCRLAADLEPGGTPVVLARMIYPGGIRDLGLIRLATGGPQYQRVSQDQWQINACPEHGPALSIGADGRYHLLWFTQGSARQGLFYAWSDDQGRRVSPPLALGDPSRLAGHGDVLALDGQAYLAWQEYDGQRTAVLARHSGDNGATWSAPVTLASAPGPADYPLLVSNGRQVFVSWYAAEAGYQLLPLPGPGPGAP